jgi:hypothetical protein
LLLQGIEMKKRIFYAAAAGTIVSMMFAACGNKKIDETASNETTVAVETEVQSDVSAINTRLGKELTATLTAGSTTLTFTDASITSNTIVDNVLTSVYGVNPEEMTVSSGSLTLTFDAQATDVGVKVVIR